GRRRCADASMHDSGAFASPAAVLHQVQKTSKPTRSTGSPKNPDSARLTIMRSAAHHAARDFRPAPPVPPIRLLRHLSRRRVGEALWWGFARRFGPFSPTKQKTTDKASLSVVCPARQARRFACRSLARSAALIHHVSDDSATQLRVSVIPGHGF